MRHILQQVLAMLSALLWVYSSAVTTPAQLCGKSFGRFVVVDVQGKDVADVTAELLGDLPNEYYQKFRQEKKYPESGGLNFKLSDAESQEMLKRIAPLRTDTDFCGNPLKQRKNSTPVRVTDAVSGQDPSVSNFGFCSSEGYMGITLLRISAPGYLTEYYLGSYLKGCRGRYSFVLTKLRETKDSTNIKRRWEQGKDKPSAR
jgi:hypothetical protein